MNIYGPMDSSSPTLWVILVRRGSIGSNLIKINQNNKCFKEWRHRYRNNFCIKFEYLFSGSLYDKGKLKTCCSTAVNFTNANTHKIFALLILFIHYSSLPRVAVLVGDKCWQQKQTLRRQWNGRTVTVSY